MDTMGIIMAEASKALSTVECSWTMMRRRRRWHRQQSPGEGRGGGDESSSMATATTSSSLVADNNDIADKEPSFSSSSTRIAPSYFSDDEDDDTRSFSSTVTRWSSSQQRGFGGNGYNNGKNGIQLTFLPDSDGLVHLIRTASNTASGVGGGGIVGEEGECSVAESSSIVTLATNPASVRKRGGFSTSCAAPMPPSSLSVNGDEMMTEPSYVSGTPSTPGGGQLSSRQSNGCGGNVHRKHPIRVSFVPIDLDLPLEEQHGGKFDVILHKLTEDILCMSKMLRERGRSGDDIDDGFVDDVDCENHDTFLPVVDKGVESSPSITRRQARASLRIKRLREYKEKVHPPCVLVDSPNNILAVMSRADMADVLSRCLADVKTKCGIPVRTPWYRVVDENFASAAGDGSTSTLRDIADEIDRSGIEYPLIAKPLSAAGTKSSHHMGIVLARDGLQRLKTPCILQEFANHGEQLFKVYVLGDSVWVSSRESLPNLPIGEKQIRNDAELVPPLKDAPPSSLQSRSRRECYVEFERPAGSRCYVEFDSQRPYPKLADFGIKAADDISSFQKSKKQRLDGLSVESCRKTEVHEQKPTSLTKINNIADGVINEYSILAKFVTADEIDPVTNVLRDAFGLELFGFDVIVKHDPSSLFNGSSAGKEILVVDVNYFPGYKEVPNFPSLLAQYLTQKAVESRVRNFDGS
ncbi:hypothetical protein ACHAXA_010785 [Cyclostephanos tholiformis]|uniref:Inositol-1,3,4-trisphosphate 5/6-kinase n=1 Tax=Cyclostephanos tholiformis TaxID=382380 RepID=A0ABD3RT80_9STRA